MTPLTRLFTAWMIAAACWALAGCACSDDPGSVGSGDDFPDPMDGGVPVFPEGGFVSHNPKLEPSQGATGSGGGPAITNPAPPDDGEYVAPTLQQANIVELVGNRLYTLSRYGLSVVDTGHLDRLSLLGRWKAEATPVALYLRGNVAIGVFVEAHERDAEDGIWKTVSSVVALDVADPTRIVRLGSFRTPRGINHSRLAGNVLYLVSHGSVEAETGTVVESLDISDPTTLRPIDSLAYRDEQYGWGPRQVMATSARLYIAGNKYENSEGYSVIHIVDITDPGGKLVQGASVAVEGLIRRYSMMDEHADVLRVVSQRAVTGGRAPVVQTFRLISSESVAPLGRVELSMPRQEQIQSVGFEATRGYVTTSKATDPILTLDLSDPVNPQQKANIPSTGAVERMVPRGDRLLTVGVEPSNPDGAIRLSLFDVADLGRPELLDALGFAPTTGGAGAVQPMRHGYWSFDDLGLMVIPFGGYQFEDEARRCAKHAAGVQLIDLIGDDLRLRGTAIGGAGARRVFAVGNRLLAISDDRAQSYGIDDRDAPTQAATLALARNLLGVAPVGDHLVRLTPHWWTGKVSMDVTPAVSADAPEPVSSVDLDDPADPGCWGGVHGSRLEADGNRVIALYEGVGHWGAAGPPHGNTALAIVDASNPAVPALQSRHVLGFTDLTSDEGYGNDSVIQSGDRVARIGQALAFLRDNTSELGNEPDEARKAWLDVVDIRDPKAPKTTILDLDGRGLSGLHVDGTSLLTSHFEPLPGDPARVRFYLDRIDLSDPGKPYVSDRINVPGSLFAWHAASRRAVLVEYTRHVEPDLRWHECYARHSYSAQFKTYDGSEQSGPGDCTWVTHVFRLVRIDESGVVLEAAQALNERRTIRKSAVGDGRIFVSLEHRNYYDCGSACEEPPLSPVLVLGGVDTGTLAMTELALTPIPDNPYSYSGYVSRMVANGTRAVIARGYGRGIDVVDAQNASAARIVDSVEFSAGPAKQIVVSGDTAWLSFGHFGIRAYDLSR